MTVFSVVMPVFNKQHYISRSIDSVLNQTISDIELIIVNDGSTDESQIIIDSYTDPRIRVIQQRNSGVSAARNRGISEACSQWIAFLDADDEYLPTFLEEVIFCSQKFPQAGAIYADPIWMRGDVQVNSFLRAESPTLLPDYFEHIVFNDGNEIHTSCVAVKKSVFHLAGKFPVGVRVGEDSDMWMRLAWTTRIAHIPKPLSIYHMDAGDSNWEDDILEEAYWVATYRTWLLQRRIPASQERSTAIYYQRYILSKALKHALLGNKKAARALIFKTANWSQVPKKYAVKVFLYALLPINEFRSIFLNCKSG
ncbi:MAG: glycosyltransferase [Desulfuromonadaceae bacterium]|nr:glycosyltransferase [Desulfuromonadaceae bacterium]